MNEPFYILLYFGIGFIIALLFDLFTTEKDEIGEEMDQSSRHWQVLMITMFYPFLIAAFTFCIAIYGIVQLLILPLKINNHLIKRYKK